MEAIEGRAGGRATPGLLGRWSERLVGRYLSGLESGAISLRGSGTEAVTFGDQDADMRAALQVHDRRSFRRIVAGGDLGFAESFMDGDWSTDDLTTLIRILAENRDRLDDLNVATALPRRLLTKQETQ